jgi:ATP-dependent Clp protease ATP-binding subunit ClpA
MKAREVDVEALKAGLVGYLDNEMKTLATDVHRDSQPTVGVRRVVTRAVDHVRSLGGGTVTGGDLLPAMFDEKDSPAVWLLRQHGMCG